MNIFAVMAYFIRLHYIAEYCIEYVQKHAANADRKTFFFPKIF